MSLQTAQQVLKPEACTQRTHRLSTTTPSQRQRHSATKTGRENVPPGNISGIILQKEHYDRRRAAVALDFAPLRSILLANQFGSFTWLNQPTSLPKARLPKVAPP